MTGMRSARTGLGVNVRLSSRDWVQELSGLACPRRPACPPPPPPDLSPTADLSLTPGLPPDARPAPATFGLSPTPGLPTDARPVPDARLLYGKRLSSGRLGWPLFSLGEASGAGGRGANGPRAGVATAGRLAAALR